MKVKSAELLDLASLFPPHQTKSLLEDAHDIELQDNGWIRWRTIEMRNDPSNPWFLAPPSMVRNLSIYEQVPSVRNMPEENPHISVVQDPELGLPKRRGRPPKQQ